MGELKIISEEGDTKVVFDPENKDEVKAAKKQFDDLISKGFSAFKVKKSGEKGKKITQFDKESGRIILVPQMQGG